jgi:hypothetical protein
MAFQVFFLFLVFANFFIKTNTKVDLIISLIILLNFVYFYRACLFMYEISNLNPIL